MKTGKAYTFNYDGITFMFTIIDNYCECYAESQYQFGFDLGQLGHVETPEDIRELLIVNYDNGNIFIDE